MYAKSLKTYVSNACKGYLHEYGDVNRSSDQDYSNYTNKQHNDKEAEKFKKSSDKRLATQSNKYCFSSEFLGITETSEVLDEMFRQYLKSVRPWRMYQRKVQEIQLSNVVSYGSIFSGMTRGGAYNQYEGEGFAIDWIQISVHVRRPAIETPVSTMDNTTWQLVVIQLLSDTASVGTLTYPFFTAQGTSIIGNKLGALQFLNYNLRRNCVLLYQQVFSMSSTVGNLTSVHADRSPNQIVNLHIGNKEEWRLLQAKTDVAGAFLAGDVLWIAISNDTTASGVRPLFTLSATTKIFTN